MYFVGDLQSQVLLKLLQGGDVISCHIYRNCRKYSWNS